MQLIMHKENNNMKNVFSNVSSLQTNCHLKLVSKKWTNIQETSG